MSERQLPADRRSRNQQGFAASLLLTPLLFFWIFLAANEGLEGGRLNRGGGSPVARATGPRSTGDCPPVAQPGGDRWADRPSNGRPPPASPAQKTPRYFCI